MNAPATRQDVQIAVDKTRSILMSSLLSRGDLQGIINQLRAGILQDLHSLHAENRASIKQGVVHRDQVMQRITNLEHAVGRVEQLLVQVVSQQSRTSNSIQHMKPIDTSSYLYQRI